MKSQLPYKEVQTKRDWEKRVLFFDPAPVYDRIKIDHYSRHPSVSVEDIFPAIPGVCACGCGKPLTGTRRKWATNECSEFGVSVRFIINGNLGLLQRYLRYYYGWKCQKCGCEDKGHDMGKNGTVSWIKVDHIIPVKKGGGGWWLSNYQLVCHDCHVGKTNEDFGWKGNSKNQPELF
jgi:5-methylcytosine-specific restriction endonuclease McrA